MALGAVMVVAAIFGQKIAVSSIQIPALKNPWLRLGGGLVGLLLIACGLVGYADKVQLLLASMRSSPATVAPDTASNTRPQQQIAPSAASLAGRWTDDRGTTYQIFQHGDAYEVNAANAAERYSLWGTGGLNGSTLTFSYETNMQSRGSAAMTISADSRVINGTLEDSRRGQVPFRLRRY